MTPHTVSEVLCLGRAFHYVGIRLFPGVWRGELDTVVGGFIDTPKIGSVSVASECKKLIFTKKDFSSQQVILVKIVRQLAHEKFVVANAAMVKILNNAHTLRTVADMSALVNMSPRQLQRTLKQVTGFSPHDFLKVLRFQQSFGRHYLAFYADQSHFIHSFRKITGYTPGEYAQKFDV